MSSEENLTSDEDLQFLGEEEFVVDEDVQITYSENVTTSVKRDYSETSHPAQIWRSTEIHQVTSVYRDAAGQLEDAEEDAAEEKSFPEFRGNLQADVTEDNDSVKITASVSGRSTPEVTWYMEDSVLSPDQPNCLQTTEGGRHTLTIKNFLIDEGNSKISCLAVNRSGAVKSSILLGHHTETHYLSESQVNLFEHSDNESRASESSTSLSYPPPKFAAPPEVVLCGKSLICEATVYRNSPEPVEVRWLTDGRLIKESPCSRMLTDRDCCHLLEVSDLSLIGRSSELLTCVAQCGEKYSTAQVDISEFGKRRVTSADDVHVALSHFQYFKCGHTVIRVSNLAITETEHSVEVSVSVRGMGAEDCEKPRWFIDDEIIISQDGFHTQCSDGRFVLEISHAAFCKLSSVKFVLVTTQTLFVRTASKPLLRSKPYIEVIDRSHLVIEVSLQSEPPPDVTCFIEGELISPGHYKHEFSREGVFTIILYDVANYHGGEVRVHINNLMGEMCFVISSEELIRTLVLHELIEENSLTQVKTIVTKKSVKRRWYRYRNDITRQISKVKREIVENSALSSRKFISAHLSFPRDCATLYLVRLCHELCRSDLCFSLGYSFSKILHRSIPGFQNDPPRIKRKPYAAAQKRVSYAEIDNQALAVDSADGNSQVQNGVRCQYPMFPITRTVHFTIKSPEYSPSVTTIARDSGFFVSFSKQETKLTSLIIGSGVPYDDIMDDADLDDNHLDQSYRKMRSIFNFSASSLESIRDLDDVHQSSKDPPPQKNDPESVEQSAVVVDKKNKLIRTTSVVSLSQNYDEIGHEDKPFVCEKYEVRAANEASRSNFSAFKQQYAEPHEYSSSGEETEDDDEEAECNNEKESFHSVSLSKMRQSKKESENLPISSITTDSKLNLFEDGYESDSEYETDSDDGSEDDSEDYEEQDLAQEMAFTSQSSSKTPDLGSNHADRKREVDARNQIRSQVMAKFLDRDLMSSCDSLQGIQDNCPTSDSNIPQNLPQTPGGPDPPKCLELVWKDLATVEVSWKPAPSAARYTIHVESADGTAGIVRSAPGSASSLVLRRMSPEEIYCVWVASVSGEGAEGRPSEMLEVHGRSDRPGIRPPELLLRLTDSAAEHGGEAALTCAFYAATHVHWYRGSRKIFENKRYTLTSENENHTLRIRDVSDFDEDTFTCVGSNEFGKIDTSARLIIKRPPKIVLSKSARENLTRTHGCGEEITIRVPIEGAVARVMTWMKDGEALDQVSMLQQGIQASLDGSGARLTICNSGRHHSGSYSLRVENDFGSDELSFEIHVLGTPGSVEDLKVTETGADWVVLSWSPPDEDGGTAVTSYVIEKREDGGGGRWRYAGCTDQTSHRLEMLDLHQPLTLRVTAENSQGRALPAQLEVPATKERATSFRASIASSGRESTGGLQKSKTPGFEDQYCLSRPLLKNSTDLFLCKDRRTGKEFLALYLPKSRRTRKHLELLEEIKHDSILKLEKSFSSSDRDGYSVAIFHNTLTRPETAPRNREIPSEHRCVEIVAQVLECYKYLHENNIMLLDLNIDSLLDTSDIGALVTLVNLEHACKLDPSQQVDLQLSGNSGKAPAPEVIANRPVGFFTDMWNLGVFTFHLLSGKSPFDGSSFEERADLILGGDLRFEPRTSWDLISGDARSFINGLLRVDPYDRMELEEAMSHPWLQSGLSRDRPLPCSLQLRNEPTEEMLRKLARDEKLRERSRQFVCPIDERDAAPRFVRHPQSHISRSVGEDVRIECKVTAFSAPLVQWRFCGGECRPGVKYRVVQEGRHHGLVVRRAAYSDMGQYVCSASNSYATVTASTTLIIH